MGIFFRSAFAAHGQDTMMASIVFYLPSGWHLFLLFYLTIKYQMKYVCYLVYHLVQSVPLLIKDVPELDP